MRILFTRFPLESAHGGAENQTMWLAMGLKERGHQVSFLGSCPILLETFGAAGFQKQSLHIGPPPVTKWYATNFLWRRKEMRDRLIASLESLPSLPDVIVMLSFSEKILLTDWAHRKGIRVFWIEHDRIGAWLTKNPWLPVLKKASALATMICVSELSKKLYVENGFNADRIACIPNGIPAPENAPYPGHREQGILRLGCIARLSEEKGVDVLLSAIADLPEASLTIVGSGPDEGYLRTLVQQDTERMGGERIVILRSVPDLDSFYASIDALVLSSRDHDPFGLVVAEGMARGVPTIVTDACGIASYVRNGIDALIVSKEDPKALAKAIHSLMDPVLSATLRESGIETARTVFALPRMVTAYEALFLGGASTRVES